MKIYNGQTIAILRPEAQLAVRVMILIYRLFGEELTITWTNGGKHMAGSLHLKNRAFDFLPPYLPTNRAGIYDLARSTMGPEYDILDEEDHGHCEWDPK